MEEDVKVTVRRTFEQYLTNKGHRKTQERFAILDTIYSIDGHFTMEKLFEIMSESKFRVSRATLYNTIDLLVDARLVIRHQFNNCSQYEKSFNMATHFHRICMHCGCVTEVRDEKLRQLIEQTHTKGFTVSHSSLYIYGTCAKCAAAIRRKERKKEKEKEKQKIIKQQ